MFSRIAVGLGAFLLVTGVVYGKAGYEYEGFTLLITLAGGALLVGIYLVSAVRRARVVLGGRGTEKAVGADIEPHVTPTIWPLVFALSTIGLVVGAIAVRWALVAGGVLFVAASIGWVLDVRRQWSHHAGAAHDEVTPDATQNRPQGPQTG
jgi:hypothetical protein